jgi:hypothetical protein
MDMFDKYYELKDSAIAFYDGGWRSADREGLQKQIEYARGEPVSEEDMDYICAVLEEIDRRIQEMEE